MPNFDTGHYFLTVLAPIKNDIIVDEDGQKVSNREKIRALLALLPTALQSWATESIGLNSPISRSLRTHFFRMFVLDNVIYNGRTKTNAIVSRLKGEKMLVPQEVDVLNTAYLVIAVEFDAVFNDGDELPSSLTKVEQDQVRDAYCKDIWTKTGDGLTSIFQNCVGFDDVKTADQFADYIRRCQVETTMSFNDYWHIKPKLKSLSVKRLLMLIIAPLIIAAIGLLGCIFGASHIPLIDKIPIIGKFLHIPSLWAFLGGIIASLAAIWFGYRLTMRRGQRPMPPGEYGDLPSVLKSLYLQQMFSPFVIKAQGASAEKLYKDFGAFIEKHEPGNKMSPTQKPGVIRSSRRNAIYTEKT